MSSRRTRLDLGVAAAFVVTIGWQLVAAAGRPGASLRPALLLLGAGVALALGRAVGARAPAAALPTLVGAGVVVSLLLYTDALDGSPLAGPLGYANADAALAVQGVAAGGLALTAARGRLRLVPAAVVVALVAMTPQVRSVAADVVLLPVLGVTVMAAWRRSMPTRAIAAATGLVVVACVVVTVALGATYHQGAKEAPPGKVAERTLTTTRVALWHDALRLMLDHPLRGVGPRRFPVASPVARRDPDTRQAHSEFLQSGAEGGVPALALLLVLVGTILARLGLERTSPLAAIGAVSVGAVAVHGSVDYVLQFPGLVVVAALLAGCAAGSVGRAPGKSGFTPLSP